MGFDDFRFEDYPPGRPLPDGIPPPILKMIEDAHRRGETVKICKGDNGAELILPGTLDDFGMAGSGEQPATEGHEPDHDCVWCNTNRLLAQVNKSDLDISEKFEAATKLIMSAAEKVHAEGAPETALILRVQAMQYTVDATNREWMAGLILDRMHEYMASAVKNAKKLAEHRKEVGVSNIGLEVAVEGLHDICVIRDLKNVSEALGEVPRFFVHPERNVPPELLALLKTRHTSHD